MFGRVKNPHDKEIAKFLKNVLGIRPSKISLYHTALVHRSASDDKVEGHAINNERLEYLGDAVLDAIVAEYLFKKFPLKPEGELTEMRSKMVCRERLGMLSRKIHLNDLITIDPRARAKCAGGDAFEALVGALFLDKGYDKTKTLVIKKLFSNYLDIDTVIYEESNFKSKILNWAQKSHKKVTFEHISEPNGRDQRLYRVKLLIDGKNVAEGLHYTIKKAEQVAAERACAVIFPSEKEN